MIKRILIYCALQLLIKCTLAQFTPPASPPSIAPVPVVTLPRPTSCVGTVSYNGYTYHVVKIGSQCWMKENLRTKKYRNGDLISTGLSFTGWSRATTGYYAYYNNSLANEATYGKLYNWYAVNDRRKLCPLGWHIPSKDEWQTLADYLGGIGYAGGKLKATSLWNAPNTGATNSTGFTAFPGGIRSPTGFGVEYQKLGTEGVFWTSTEKTVTEPDGRILGGVSAYNIFLTHNSQRLDIGFNDQHSGFSCRCIKD